MCSKYSNEYIYIYIYIHLERINQSDLHIKLMDVLSWSVQDKMRVRCFVAYTVNIYIREIVCIPNVINISPFASMPSPIYTF